MTTRFPVPPGAQGQPNGGPPPRQIPPGFELIQPVPLQFDAWQTPAPDGRGHAVIFRIATPLGPLHFIVSPDEAIQIGGRLRQQGKAAQSGLTLPPGVRLGDVDKEVVLDGHGDRITEADAEALAEEIIAKTGGPPTDPRKETP